MGSYRIIRRWRFKIISRWTVASKFIVGGCLQGVANTLFSPAVFCVLHLHFVWRRKYQGSCHVHSSGKLDPWAVNTVRVPWVRFQCASKEMTRRKKNQQCQNGFKEFISFLVQQNTTGGAQTEKKSIKGYMQLSCKEACKGRAVFQHYASFSISDPCCSGNTSWELDNVECVCHNCPISAG